MSDPVVAGLRNNGDDVLDLFFQPIIRSGRKIQRQVVSQRAETFSITIARTSHSAMAMDCVESKRNPSWEFDMAGR